MRMRRRWSFSNFQCVDLAVLRDFLSYSREWASKLPGLWKQKTELVSCDGGALDTRSQFQGSQLKPVSRIFNMGNPYTNVCVSVIGIATRSQQCSF